MRLRKAVLFAGVLFALASNVAAQRPAPATRVRDLDAYARLLAMTDTRTLDTSVVDRALGSTWQPLRAAGALAIGQIGADAGKAGVPRLRRLLSDSDPLIAANAAYALGLIRDTSSISGLVAALAREGEVGREAAWALGEIGAPARSAITTALARNHDVGVTIQLLLAAAKMRPLPIAEVRPYLTNAVPTVVWAAAYAIARTRTPAGVRDLVSLNGAAVAQSHPRTRIASSRPPYDDPGAAPARIRAEIGRGLASSAAGDSLASKAFEVLSRLAADSDPHVRVNALRSLGTYRERATEMLIHAARDVDPNVRIAAAQSLATALPAAFTGFAALWDRDTAIVYRASLLASAVKAGLRPPQLRDWATSSDWRLRAAVASAMGDTLDRAFAIARVRPLLTDPDPRVREAAYGALPPTAAMPLEDGVHAMLLQGLRDPDFYVRATVIGALAERPAIADLPAMLDSYRLAAGDSANDARLAAIQYVTALWKSDSTSFTAASLATLKGMRAPSDPLERAAGKQVPAWAAWLSVRTVPRSRAWYDSLVRTMVLPITSGRTINATIYTVRGPIRLELFGSDAPITVWNFLSLARSGYYRNTRFHRVVPNFVAQDGDPRDDGNGGPGYSIRDEMNRHRYDRGAVGMALSGPDTGGSQYFITHSPQPHLDGHYTVFGRVVDGFDVLDRIVQGDLITRIDPK